MVTPGNVVGTQAKMDALTGSVDAYQRSVAELAGQLAKDKLITDKTAADIGSINAKIDLIQPVVSNAVTAVLEAEYSGDKVRDIVTGVSAANQATASVNPYAPLIDAGTKLLIAFLGVGTVGGVYAAKKNGADAAESKAKYTAHKQGTEELKLAHPDIAAELYSKIGAARTRNGV